MDLGVDLGERGGFRGFPLEKSVDLGVDLGEKGGFRGFPPEKKKKSVDLGVDLVFRFRLVRP